ncbi:MAG: FecR domain-containing protein [Deltaproteobacteria bacterium]|nr:FecR domain-containing protein [Deltaproteobacteria bacterium]
MSHDPLDLLTARLRESVSDHGDVEALPAARDVAISRIADALRERAKVRRRRRVYGVLAAAAAVLVVVGAGAVVARRGATGEQAKAPDLGRMSDPQGGVTALRDGKPEALSQGARVGEGTELVTAASSEAHLDFDSGSRVTLGGSARVRLVEQSNKKRFAISAGSLTAKVAKLGVNERFVVATPDAEIEVRGTAFRVSVVAPDPACEGGTPTRLVVDEGVVVVRHGGHEERVAAGGKWPACATATAATASPVVAPVAVSPAAPRATAKVAPEPSTPTTTAAGASPAPVAARAPATDASSRLAEQNDLFDEAMRAKRAGDTGSALAKLEQLRASYPGGPLSENADVERMRILATTNRPRAVQAAKDYLRRRPSGFARAEAEALVSAGP